MLIFGLSGHRFRKNRRRFFVALQTLRIADIVVSGTWVAASSISPGSVENPSSIARSRYAARLIGINPGMNHIHPYRRLGALTLVGIAALTFTAACTSDDQAPAGNAAEAAAGGPEPKTVEGAKQAAQTVFDRFSGGDFAGAWDMYTAAGKKAISKDDYVKLNQICSRKGLAIQLTSARLDGPDKAVVIAKQLVAAQSYTMMYEGNAWKLAPAKEGLALYSQGADKAIAAQKKAGTCANNPG
jgi:hypothetical protein